MKSCSCCCWCCYCTVLASFIYKTVSRKTLTHCSDFTFLEQQIAHGYKPPSLTFLLTVFTRNNEAYVSQERWPFDSSVNSTASGPFRCFFLPYYCVYGAHCSQMTCIFNKWPDQDQWRNALNVKAIKYPTMYTYTRAVWYFSDWVLDPLLSMGQCFVLLNVDKYCSCWAHNTILIERNVKGSYC